MATGWMVSVPVEKHDGDEGPVQLIYAVNEVDEARAVVIATSKAAERYALIEPITEARAIGRLSDKAVQALVPTPGEANLNGWVGPARFIA